MASASGLRLRRTTKPLTPSIDELVRAAGIGRGDDRLVRQERLERDVAEILVEGRIERPRARRDTARGAARRRPRRGSRRDRRRRPRAASALDVAPAACPSPATTSRIGVSTRAMADTSRSTRLTDSMPADRQHVAAVAAPPRAARPAAAGGTAPRRRGRCISRTRSAVFCALANTRRHSPSISVSSRISVSRSADVALVVAEVAVDGAAQLVGGAVLMDQPRDLVRVPRRSRSGTSWRSPGRSAGRCSRSDRAAATPPRAAGSPPSDTT